MQHYKIVELPVSGHFQVQLFSVAVLQMICSWVCYKYFVFQPDSLEHIFSLKNTCCNYPLKSIQAICKTWTNIHVAAHPASHGQICSITTFKFPSRAASFLLQHSKKSNIDCSYITMPRVLEVNKVMKPCKIPFRN